MTQDEKRKKIFSSLGMQTASYPYYSYDFGDCIIEVSYKDYTGTFYEVNSKGDQNSLFDFNCFDAEDFKRFFKFLNDKFGDG